MTHDPEKPILIHTENSADFFAVCERESRGELKIHSLEVGKRNSHWTFQVFYPEQKQGELFDQTS